MSYVQSDQKTYTLNTKLDVEASVGIFTGCATDLFQKEVASNCVDILKKNNIPATIYLVSRNIIAKPWAWWVELWNFIKKNEKIFLHQKPNTTKIDKLRVFIKTTFIFLYKYLLCSPKDHDQSLHSSLKGLPNTHERL